MLHVAGRLKTTRAHTQTHITKFVGQWATTCKHVGSLLPLVTLVSEEFQTKYTVELTAATIRLYRYIEQVKWYLRWKYWVLILKGVFIYSNSLWKSKIKNHLL